MAIAPRALSLEEFLQLPEQKPALEYIGGVVEQKMSPKARHSALQQEFAERVNAVARQVRVARAFPELRASFAGASVVPDVAVYRWARIARDDKGELLDDTVIPPDIAIEIASPGQSSNALFRRCRWYVAHGVELALLVDPADRSILAFFPDGRVQEWTGQDGIDLSVVVPDFDLTVEQLFASLTE